MTTTMVWSVIFSVLVHIFLVSHGVQLVKADTGASLPSNVYDVSFRDSLWCDAPAAHLTAEDEDTREQKTNGSESHQRRCYFSSPACIRRGPVSRGLCYEMVCDIDNWENLTCRLGPYDLDSHMPGSGPIAVSLQRLLSGTDENTTQPNRVVCESEDTISCSVPLDGTATESYIMLLSLNITGTAGPTILLQIPATPVKPNPPVNLTHIQTIQAELILNWDNPLEFDKEPLRYEVRYSSKAPHPAWQVLSVREQLRLSLDLKPRLNYTVQVRCSGLQKHPLWSDWSEPHHIYLHTVSYIPREVVARPGEDVTVYCVFNDHNIDASTAVWKLNMEETLHHSQAVSQRVSRITLRPSETRMYDLLQCKTQGRSLEYSQIYVDGASIDISCKTNNNVDAMDCSWNNTEWSKLTFRSRWADLTCDEMEAKEKAGEVVGEMGTSCLHYHSEQKTCRIHPLRMNCYKLWLELGPVKSRPVYLSPIDYVKPRAPTNVEAVTLSSRLLKVTWEPPSLPVFMFQCQLRYHSPSADRAHPEWKDQAPVLVGSVEVEVSDMCRVYVVEVRCRHTSGTGFWSDWSRSVLSRPQNSRAPERGPDFWRLLQDDPRSNQTNVTLLFENPQVSGSSYCIDGFMVQRQTSSGSVRRERLNLVSSYSFEWNQDVQTVTVEAYNSLGSSSDNFNMTLEKKPKRRCIRSFRVLSINSSCVSLSWILLDHSPVPLFMVVQWVSHGQRDSDHHRDQSGESWARLPYTDRLVYLRGNFCGSEDCSFTLFPVFADGEAEPVFAKATRGDPAAYMMLTIICFLSIVLFITLVLSQNQMKKFGWKNVPNPNKCSWAKGLDLKKVETINQLFQPPEGLPVWPLLLPSENISNVVVMDKVDLSSRTTVLVQAPLVTVTPDPATPFSSSPPSGVPSEVDHTSKSDLLLGRAPSFVLNIDNLTASNPRIDAADEPPDSSAQASVTYATVLLSNPVQDHLTYKDGGGNSSSDEGNFSANNSDISGSFPCGFWELDDPRRSCSYNSAEELSETSEQEDGEEAREEKDLYYLGMDYPAEDEESEDDEEEIKTELLKNGVMNRDGCLVESRLLLGPGDSREHSLPQLYLPQFRTAQTTQNHICDSHTDGF